MGGTVMSRLVIITAGLLYPAYSSYKAIKSSNAKLYAHWIMYWVVFALFSSTETFTDFFLSWIPFYYEFKVIFVLWLSMPHTKGSRVLYRKLVHPNLSKREQDIELFIESARRKSLNAVVNVGSKGINMVTNAMVTAAVSGQKVVSNHLRSRSAVDLKSLRDNDQLYKEHTSVITRMNSLPAVVKEAFCTKSPRKLFFEDDNGDHRINSDRSNSKPSFEDESSSDDYESITYTLDNMEIVKGSNHAGMSPCHPSPDEFSPQYHTMPCLRNVRTKQMHSLPSNNETSLRRKRINVLSRD